MGKKHLKKVLLEIFWSLKNMILDLSVFALSYIFVCTWCIRPGVSSTLIQIVLISSLDQKTKAPLM